MQTSFDLSFERILNDIYCKVSRLSRPPPVFLSQIMILCWQPSSNTLVCVQLQSVTLIQRYTTSKPVTQITRGLGQSWTACQAVVGSTSSLRQPLQWPKNKLAIQQRTLTCTAAGTVSTLAAASSAAAQGGILASLVAAWHTNPASVMLAAGALLLGTSLSIFLLAAIPGILVRVAFRMLITPDSKPEATFFQILQWLLC